MNPYKEWDKLLINWCRISAINSIIPNLRPHNDSIAPNPLMPDEQIWQALQSRLKQLKLEREELVKKLQAWFFFVCFFLAGGFKYFVIFIPTWGNDPI